MTGGVLLPSSWFYLNNLIRDIRAKFGIPNFPQSPDIGQNTDRCISDCQIFGEYFINENFHNSRTSYNTDMKLGSVTKLDKSNRATSKKINDDVMLPNFDVFVFFHFAAIPK